MGLFAQQPQHRKDDWTGLPSEPLRQESPAERLNDDAATSVDALGLGDLFGNGQVKSIAVPIDPAIEPSPSDASDEAPDESGNSR